MPLELCIPPARVVIASCEIESACACSPVPRLEMRVGEDRCGTEVAAEEVLRGILRNADAGDEKLGALGCCAIWAVSVCRSDDSPPPAGAELAPAPGEP